MTRRQRHLNAVDEHLDDLLIGLQHPGNRCRVCGGYKSLDTCAVKVINEANACVHRHRLDAGKQGK